MEPLITRPVSDNRGMALLITIMVISLLTALTVQFARSMRNHYFSSASARDGAQLQMIAASGLNIGAALLTADGEKDGFDTLLDSWAVIEPELFQDVFPRGMLRLTVQDLSGRLQVNGLVVPEGEGGKKNNANKNREILIQLLLSGTFEIEEEQKAREIVDALVDWIDTDDRESDFGAESAYYRSLEDPYDCANGPVPVIEDLLKVKGIDRALLFGHGEKKGLADFLTVYGTDGKININTAEPELIKAMAPQLSEETVLTLDEYRREEGNRETLEQAGWYKNVSGWPGDVTLPDEVATTKSSFFKIAAAGSFNEQRREITAVVERDATNRVDTRYKRVE